jgi:hypothetical protein
VARYAERGKNRVRRGKITRMLTGALFCQLRGDPRLVKGSKSTCQLVKSDNRYSFMLIIVDGDCTARLSGEQREW